MNRNLFWKAAPCVAAGLVAVWLVGCHPAHVHTEAPDADHAHVHTADAETTVVQFTVVGERHEIFAEHRLVVAGTPTKFITHVTDLTTHEPRAAGPLRFRVALNGEPPVEHTEAAPSRPGIYEPLLSFPKPGEWQMSVVVPDASGDSVVALPKVAVFVTSHDAGHAQVPEPPHGITFLKEQQWKLRLATGIVGSRRLVERVALPAQTLAKPGHRAGVIAPVAGQVLAPGGGAFPLPGEHVKAGQLLALLQPVFSDAAAKVVESEAGLASAEAAFRQAESTVIRVRKLVADQAKSERELQESETAFATARARLEAATALQSTYRQASPAARTNLAALPLMELRAPIAGRVSSLGAGLGEPVTAGDTVFAILDPEVLWIEARIPEGNLRRLAAAKGAGFEDPGTPGTWMDVGTSGGRWVFTGLEVDPATRTVPLIYEVPNADGRWRVGQTLTLQVETTRAEEALAVPDSAIVEDAGEPVAYVQLAGETFERRALTLGIRDGDWVQVLAGLKSGDRIVTRGAFAVRLAAVSSTIPSHSHAH